MQNRMVGEQINFKIALRGMCKLKIYWNKCKLEYKCYSIKDVDTLSYSDLEYFQSML